MIRLALILPLALANCSMGKVPLPATQAEVGAIVAADRLQGRWTITSVNGRQVAGPWLELGGEGIGTVITTNTAIFVASPRPPSQVHLGCNDWYPNGWARNGDKLTFGIEMSHSTERGCDAATMALDDEVYAIVGKAMTMDYAQPHRLRLINEKGSLELVRRGIGTEKS